MMQVCLVVEAMQDYSRNDMLLHPAEQQTISRVLVTHQARQIHSIMLTSTGWLASVCMIMLHRRLHSNLLARHCTNGVHVISLCI